MRIRPRLLAATLMLGIAAVIVPGAGAAQASPAAFTIAVLPDTQILAANHPAIFHAQTQWIADNWQQENIAFVVHEGDIVNNNSVAQWEVAQSAMRRLDGEVPYSVLPGNHDMGTGGSANTRDTTLYNAYFPLSHYAGGATFGGVYPAEPGKYDNNYHTFSAGGTNWLVLSLEFGPRDPVLDWANQVVADHPDHRVIVMTHTYMFSDETRHSTGHSWNPHNYGVASGPGGVNDGEQMWEKFVKGHPNITMVLNGHVLNDGQGRRVNVGDYGNKVYQMLANYQNQTNGGNGFLRLLEIDPVEGTVQATSYSPWLDQFKTDWQNDFEYTNVELGPPDPDPTLPSYLLTDDFGDGNMNGWTIVDKGTISAPSNWQVTRGEIEQTSNIYGPSVPAVEHRQGTYAYYNSGGAFAWDDYSLTAALRSTDNDGIGLIFRYQDPNNYYKLDLDAQRNFARLFKVVGGTETIIAHTAAPGYTQGASFNVEVTVSGNQIQVLRNEIDIFGGPVTDNALTSGTVALYCWGNQNCYFDDVLVTP